MKLTDVPSRYSAAVLGDSGTGKTRLIGTLCQLVPTVVLTGDPDGLETLRAMDDLQEPEVLLIEDWSRAWDYYEQLQVLASQGYKAIAIDDFGAVQDTAERTVSYRPRGRDEERMRPNQREQRVRQALMLGERRLQLQQFGELATASETFLYEVLRLPYSFFLVTVLQELRRHPRTGEEHLMPALTGGFRSELLARFSLVGNTFAHQRDGKLYWCLTTKPHPRIPTKSRYGDGRTWVDPTAEKLLSHMRRQDEPESALERQIGTGLND